MKQMRSRFRFLALALVCAFLLTFTVCAVTVLKLSGFSLSSLKTSLPVIGTAAPPVSADSVEPPSDEPPTPSPSGPVTDEKTTPGTDNSPEPEYNIFGL